MISCFHCRLQRHTHTQGTLANTTICTHCKPHTNREIISGFLRSRQGQIQISYFFVLLTYSRLIISKSSRPEGLGVPHGHFSTPSLEGPDPTPCEDCGNDITRPSAFYALTNCPVCTNRTVFCVVCNGRCTTEQIREDMTYPDCNACVGTGMMVSCSRCDGTGVRLEHIGTREIEYPCVTCGNKGALRCPRCDAAGEVSVFRRFCPGADLEDRPRRRHPNACNIPRRNWSRVDLDERNTS